MTEKEYPGIVICGFTGVPGEYLNSYPVDDYTLTQMQKFVEKGGKLKIRYRSEKAIALDKAAGKKAFIAYLEAVSQEETDRQYQQWKAQNPKSSL
jgi:radical SAM superfamily enzyme with C-terminal helix-hairpin-helix motif